MKKIIIRVDGRKDLGMGHLHRCLIIAKYMHKNFGTVAHFIVEEDSVARAFFENKSSQGIKPHFFSCGSSLSVQAKILIDHSRDFEIKHILIDLLEFNLTEVLIGPLRNNELKIACIIDDSEYREVNVDLVLNGNPNQQPAKYEGLGGRYLIGFSYFIMSEKYDYGRLDFSGELKKVLVTLGGSDHNNLLFKLLNFLVESDEFEKVIVISSGASGYLDKLKNFANQHCGKLELLVDIDGLYDTWKRCDFAITAGGNTLFERIAAGVPGMTLCQLDRQMEIAQRFEQLGVNYNIGFGATLPLEELKEKIQNFVKDNSLAIKQAKNFDNIMLGSGLRLFVKELREL